MELTAPPGHPADAGKPDEDVPVRTDTRFASRFEIDDATRVCVVSLAGKFDPEAVDDLHPQVQELVRAGYRKFVFDMSGVEHIGSMGLRLLVGLANQVKDGGSVSLCDLSDGVRSVFRMTRVDQVLRAYPSRVEAVAVASGR